MGYSNLLKILLVVSFPLLLFLLVSEFAVFDNSFYNEKFLQYNVRQNVPNATSLHYHVINFVQGKSNYIPNEFNEREKQHLSDVRNAISISKIILYALLVLFASVFLVPAFKLKFNRYMIKFAGKVMFFGGLLAIFIAASLFLLITFNFSSTFESLHRLFFKSGTYTFDPAKELIVNLYPGGLFMDLGIRISEWVVILSVILILTGIFLIFKTKNKKNKY